MLIKTTFPLRLYRRPHIKLNILFQSNIAANRQYAFRNIDNSFDQRQRVAKSPSIPGNVIPKYRTEITLAKETIHLDQNWKLIIFLKSVDNGKELLIKLAEFVDGESSKITMPLEHAYQMFQRLIQLEAINFNVERKIEKISLDRFKERNLGNGTIQQIYTHRIPGLLHGSQKSAFYISILKLNIDLALKRAEFSDGNKTNAINIEEHNSQSLMFPPQLFISQHTFKLKELHAWIPSIYSIQMPIYIVSKFIKGMGNIFGHYQLRNWKEKYAQQIGIINKGREHENFGRMFSFDTGWPFPPNSKFFDEFAKSKQQIEAVPNISFMTKKWRPSMLNPWTGTAGKMHDKQSGTNLEQKIKELESIAPYVGLQSMHIEEEVGTGEPEEWNEEIEDYFE